MRLFLKFILCAAIVATRFPAGAAAPEMERVRVSADGRGFALGDAGRAFRPWGFNYDHDEAGRLIEDYWHGEWPKVREDFFEMKELGANVVRVHLQLGRFMRSEPEENPAELRQLARLVRLAEETGLRLDVTGLGCYHKRDVPAWIDALPEERRWEVQARFWESVARACGASPAIFCFDLMNEPIAPIGGVAKDWLGPAFAGKHFVQRVALDPRGRAPEPIAREWIRRMTRAIRTVDAHSLITVGLVSWSLKRPKVLYSGFDPHVLAGEVDFISVHLYPEAKKVDADIETLRGFAVGKPIVIEETFPLKCSREEFARFLRESKSHASGWIGFYWGRTLAECRKSREIADAMMASWLEIFQAGIP